MPEWQTAQTGGIAPSSFQCVNDSEAELEWPDRDHAAIAAAFGMAICSGANGPVFGMTNGGAWLSAAGSGDCAKTAVIAQPATAKATVETPKIAYR